MKNIKSFQSFNEEVSIFGYRKGPNQHYPISQLRKDMLVSYFGTTYIVSKESDTVVELTQVKDGEVVYKDGKPDTIKVNQGMFGI